MQYTCILTISLFSLNKINQSQYFQQWDVTNVNGNITVKHSCAASLPIHCHHQGPQQGLSKVPHLLSNMSHVSYINSSWQAVSIYYLGIAHSATPVASSKARWKLEIVTLDPRTWGKRQWDPIDDIRIICICSKGWYSRVLFTRALYSGTDSSSNYTMIYSF